MHNTSSLLFILYYTRIDVFGRNWTAAAWTILSGSKSTYHFVNAILLSSNVPRLCTHRVPAIVDVGLLQRTGSRSTNVSAVIIPTSQASCVYSESAVTFSAAESEGEKFDKLGQPDDKTVQVPRFVESSCPHRSISIRP